MAARKRKPGPALEAPEADVTLVPTGTAFIGGVPAIEQTVSASRAADLLRYQPPAFAVKQAPEPDVSMTPAPDSNEAPAAPAAGEEI